MSTETHQTQSKTETKLLHSQSQFSISRFAKLTAVVVIALLMPRSTARTDVSTRSSKKPTKPSKNAKPIAQAKVED